MSSASPRKPGLDALRALAITLVVVMHLVPQASWLSDDVAAIFSFGSRGVDLFFVLSGYLVGGIVLREMHAGPTWGAALAFYRRRAYRILPAYFVVLALYLGTIPLPREAPLPPLWPYLVFLQTYVGGPPSFFAGSWSLCVEEHFYLALPLTVASLWVARVRRPAAIALVLATAFVALAAWRLSLHLDYVDHAFSHFRTDGLLVGVVLAAVEMSLRDGLAPLARRWWLAAPLVLAAFACAGYAHLRSPTLWQPSFAVAFGGLVALAAGGLPALRWLGERAPVRGLARVSYSLYLVHPLVFRALEKAWFGRRWDEPAFAVAYVVLALGLGLLVAQLLHRFVEAPMLARRDRAGEGRAGGAGGAGGAAAPVVRS